MALQTFAKKSAAHLAWRRETIQRPRAALPATGTHRSRRRGHSPCLPGVVSMLGRRAVLARGGRAGSNYLRAALADTQMLFSFFFSRALGKASRAQRPHKTHRLIRPHPPNPRRAASHTNSPPSTWKASRSQRPHKTHRLISHPALGPAP
jgi:hypothetical protein